TKSTRNSCGLLAGFPVRNATSESGLLPKRRTVSKRRSEAQFPAQGYVSEDVRGASIRGTRLPKYDDSARRRRGSWWLDGNSGREDSPADPHAPYTAFQSESNRCPEDQNAGL